MKKHPLVKILDTPRILIILRGFLDGRTKAAALDDETGLITSGFIISSKKRFYEYVEDRSRLLEKETNALRSESNELLLKIAQAKNSLAMDKPQTVSETIADKRAVRRCEYRREAYANSHTSDVQKLLEISGKINSKELAARQEVKAAGAALESVFGAYTRGVTLSPVNDDQIPDVSCENPFALYHNSHRLEDEQVRAILRKEVFSNA